MTKNEEVLELFDAFSKSREEVYARAETDLRAIRNGDVPKDMPIHRIQAAYSLACEDVFAKLEEVDALFRPFAPTVPDGLSHIGLCSSGLVASGDEARVHAFPQETFKPLYYLVDPECAPHFDLVSRRTGYMEQTLTADPIPCSVFTRGLHIFGPLKWDTAQIGQEISVHVRNTSNRAMRFMSTVVGKTPPPPSFPPRPFLGSFPVNMAPLGQPAEFVDGDVVILGFGASAGDPGGDGNKEG